MKMVHTPREIHLKIRGGMYVIISDFDDGLKLCALHRQRQRRKYVLIQERIVDHRIQMAFCFDYEEEKHLLKVEGDALKLQKSKEFKPTSGNWFEKISAGLGNYYKLLSVEEPRRYLCMERTKQRILCLHRDDPVLVTDE